MIENCPDDRPIETHEVIDVLLMVYGGGGSIGLPDPTVDPMVGIINNWSNDQRQSVIDYVGAVYAVANDNEGVDVPHKPECLIQMMNTMDCQFA